MTSTFLKPRIMQRKILPGTRPQNRTAGFTVLHVDDEAGKALTVRTLDLQAWANANRMPVEAAISILLSEQLSAVG